MKLGQTQRNAQDTDFASLIYCTAKLKTGYTVQDIWCGRIHSPGYLVWPDTLSRISGVAGYFLGYGKLFLEKNTSSHFYDKKNKCDFFLQNKNKDSLVKRSWFLLLSYELGK